jgi:hypothetical protein
MEPEQSIKKVQAQATSGTSGSVQNKRRSVGEAIN